MIAIHEIIGIASLLQGTKSACSVCSFFFNWVKLSPTHALATVLIEVTSLPRIYMQKYLLEWLVSDCCIVEWLRDFIVAVWNKHQVLT